MAKRDQYLIKSVLHASTLVSAFGPAGETLGLAELCRRSGLSKNVVFRLLYTFSQCGWVEKTGTNQYRLAIGAGQRRRWRIGYASPGIDSQFSREVTDGLRVAADHEAGVELLVRDNRFQPKVALRNAEYYVREGVDLVIEFQVDAEAAEAIAELYRKAGLPFIAINHPHPGATYFGANSYAAGFMAGRSLGRWAEANWQGKFEEILLLDVARASHITRSRLTGLLNGLREVVPAAADRAEVKHLDGGGQFEAAWEAVRRHLARARARRSLVGAVYDNMALGGLRAFEEAGMAEQCAVAGQNGSLEARNELRRPGSRLIATVAYFPEQYGRQLIQLAGEILTKRAVPPAVFTEHQVLTARNVDRAYPNDELLGKG